MRDTGLEQAIRAAGGVGALAHKIGISQPSVSNWSRVPAERVVSVEAVTGVTRAILRPDLFGDPEFGKFDDAAHASEYALLAALIASVPDAELLQRLAERDRTATAVKLVHAALAEAAASLPA
jgi:hypothetical protein